ncbi:MAG: hypothetical protein ACYTF4_12190, partial [Planctomycetota bacterium]
MSRPLEDVGLVEDRRACRPTGHRVPGGLERFGLAGFPNHHQQWVDLRTPVSKGCCKPVFFLGVVRAMLNREIGFPYTAFMAQSQLPGQVNVLLVGGGGR